MVNEYVHFEQSPDLYSPSEKDISQVLNAALYYLKIDTNE